MDPGITHSISPQDMMDQVTNFDFDCPCQQCRRVICILIILIRLGINPDLAQGPTEKILSFLWELQ